MGREKPIKQSTNKAAWAELDAIDGGKRPRLVIPEPLMFHDNYIAMSYPARCLLWEIAMAYNGRNNGYLSAEWTKFRHRGVGSHHTLRDAIAEHVYYGWLVQTQIGGRDHKPNLYGITWRRLNWNADKPLTLVNESDCLAPLYSYNEPREPYQKPDKRRGKSPIVALRDAA